MRKKILARLNYIKPIYSKNELTKKNEPSFEKLKKLYLPLKYNYENINKIDKNFIYNNKLFKNKNIIINKNLKSVGNIKPNLNLNNINKKGFSQYVNHSCSPLKFKNKELKNIIKDNKLIFETNNCLITEEPRKNDEYFFIKTIYKPNKIYNIVKTTNKRYNELFKSNIILRKNNTNTEFNNYRYNIKTNMETNKTKENFFNTNNYFHSKSFKFNRIKNIILDNKYSVNLPKMRLSKNIILNMYPINFKVILKKN